MTISVTEFVGLFREEFTRRLPADTKERLKHAQRFINTLYDASRDVFDEQDDDIPLYVVEVDNIIPVKGVLLCNKMKPQIRELLSALYTTATNYPVDGIYYDDVGVFSNSYRWILASFGSSEKGEPYQFFNWVLDNQEAKHPSWSYSTAHSQIQSFLEKEFAYFKQREREGDGPFQYIFENSWEDVRCTKYLDSQEGSCYVFQNANYNMTIKTKEQKDFIKNIYKKLSKSIQIRVIINLFNNEVGFIEDDTRIFQYAPILGRQKEDEPSPFDDAVFSIDDNKRIEKFFVRFGEHTIIKQMTYGIPINHISMKFLINNQEDLDIIDSLNSSMGISKIPNQVISVINPIPMAEIYKIIVSRVKESKVYLEYGNNLPQDHFSVKIKNIEELKGLG